MPRTSVKQRPKRKATEKKVRKIVRSVIASVAELKHLNVSASTTISTTVTFTQLNAAAQGITDVLRIGDVVNYKALRFRFSLKCADATNLIRIVLFYYKSDSVPASTDLFEDTTSNSATLFSPQNQDKKPQVKFIFDKLYAMNTVTQPYMVFDKRFKLRGKGQFFNNSATLGYNNIHMAVLSDSSAISHPDFVYYSTMYFTDE